MWENVWVGEDYGVIAWGGGGGGRAKRALGGGVSDRSERRGVVGERSEPPAGGLA